MNLRRTLAASLLVGGWLATLVLACGGGTTTLRGGPEGGEASSDATRADAPTRPETGSADTSPDTTVDASDGAIYDAGVPDGDAGIPTLVELRLTGADSAPPLVLTPAFSPDVNDYYVVCAQGSNPFTVTMTASPGAVTQITAPIVSGVAPTQTLTQGVLEGSALVAAAKVGARTTEYWIRCLPHDFPPLTWAPHPEAGAVTPGYYMMANFYETVGQSIYIMVLNGSGVPVWYQHALESAFNVDDVVPGAISYATITYVFDFLSPPTVKTAPSVVNDQHELRYLDGGDILLTSAPERKGVDLLGLSIPFPDGGSQPLGADSAINDCVLLELDPAGNTVWSWDALDHLDPVQDTTWAQLGFAGASEVIDVFHCNAIDVDLPSGNLLVSARHLDSILYIEKSSGKILWKMGGKTFTKDNAAYVPVADPFFRQHDARLQPGWTTTCTGARGQISLYDDETDIAAVSRAALYDVRVDFADGGGACDGGDGGDASLADGGPEVDAGGPGATLVWQYPGTANAEDMGGFRISSDGSRVIDWGAGGTTHTATEVSLGGQDLLDIDVGDPGLNPSYRTVKVPLTAFDLDVLRATAGQF